MYIFSVPGVTNPFGMGYLFNPYAAYANGAAQLVSKPSIFKWTILQYFTGYRLEQIFQSCANKMWAQLANFSKFSKLSSFVVKIQVTGEYLLLIYGNLWVNLMQIGETQVFK